MPTSTPSTASSSTTCAREDIAPESLGSFARLAFNMHGKVDPREWADIMPQIFHVHAKFYDIDEARQRARDGLPGAGAAVRRGRLLGLLLQRVGGPRVRRSRRGRPDRPGAQAARPHPPLDHRGARRPVSPRLELRALCRVVVDNDFAGDPDGLLALAHHLLAPTNRVVADHQLVPEPVVTGPATPARRRRRRGAGGRAGRRGRRPGAVRRRRERGPLDGRGAPSAAADAIVAEARRDDRAAALRRLRRPAHQRRRGAASRPRHRGAVDAGVDRRPPTREGVFEYNRDTDPAAADFVLDLTRARRAPVPARDLPAAARTRSPSSRPDVGGAGRLGQWMWTHFASPPDWIVLGGVWPHGDSPPLLVTALTDRVQQYTRDPGRPRTGPAPDLHRR